MGKPGLENREDSVVKKTLGLFWTIRRQSQETERILIFTKIPHKRKPFDCDLGRRNKACSCGQSWLCMPRYFKSKSLFWNFRTIKILMRGKIQWFDLLIDLHQFQAFGRDYGGRHPASSYGELRVSISRLNIINSIIWNIGKSMQEKNRQKIHRSFWLRPWWKRKPVVMGETWGWVWRSRKTIMKRIFFGKFGPSGF